MTSDQRFLIGVTVVCVVLAGAAVHHALEERNLAIASVASECTVIDAWIGPRTESSSSGSYPEVVLEHTVLGKTYRRTDTGPKSITSAGITLPKVASRIRCHYVAGQPDLVTIYPGKPTHTAVWVGLAVFVLLVPLAIRVLPRRRR